MSGVYIKDMEMPKNCLACDWCAHTIPADNYICYRLNRAVIGVAKEDVDETVNACCPLVPVPPHGKCIDADALIKELTLDDEDDNSGASLLMAIFLEVLKAAPTIIEAEEGE